MRPRPAPEFRARWAALVAVAGGFAGYLAFPTIGWWPMAAVSVALLSIAVRGRRARTGAWLGYLYGAAFFLPLMHWTGVYVGPVPWLILCLAFAAFWALLGAILPCLDRLPAAPLWVGAAWVLEEFARDRIPFGGLPWGRLAFSQATSPVRWFAALGGAPLVTFVVAVAGAGLASAARAVSFRERRWHCDRRALATGLAVLAAVPLLGLVLSWPLDPARGGRTIRVALVQGGLPNLGLEFEQRARQVLDNHVKQTLKLAQEIKAGTVARPDVVLWPEDSSDVDPFHDAAAYREIDNAVQAVGVPVLIGAILDGPGPTHRRNVGILWSPTTGPDEKHMYVKRHPVPFAEYIPLRGIAEWVSSDAKTVTQDMVAGHGNGLVPGGPVPIGDVICFDVAYDPLVHSSVAAGAQLVVVQTNNATFGYTAETYQQLAISRLRAVETGRTVVQVATTGKSAVVRADGSIQDSTGKLYHSQVLVDDVQVRTATTLATRVGPWPEYVLTLLAAAGVAATAVVWWRDRRNPTAAPAGADRTPHPSPEETETVNA